MFFFCFRLLPEKQPTGIVTANKKKSDAMFPALVAHKSDVEHTSAASYPARYQKDSAEARQSARTAGCK